MAIRIEIGSGEYPRDLKHRINSDADNQYIHMDIRFGLPHQDIQADILYLPFQDSSIEEILAVQIIEHIHWVIVHQAFIECYRVLKPSGLLKLYTFDFWQLVGLMRDKKISFQRGLNWLYAGGRYPENIHRGAFSVDYMREMLEERRFKIIKLVGGESLGGDGLWVEAQK